MANQRIKSPKKRKPPIEVLQELEDQLNGIDSILPAPPSSLLEALDHSGESDSENREPAKNEKEESSDDEDELDENSDLSDEDFEEYDGTGSVSIAVEEIEVAVDELLTEVNIKLRESGRREVDSLSDFFGRYYGAGADITGTALEFEDAINGYLELVFGDYLERANDSLHSMIAFVTEEVQKCSR